MNNWNKWKVPLNKPIFRNTSYELVENVMRSGMVSQGEMVERFEEEIRKYVGAKYAIAVSSCTAGLWMVGNVYNMRGKTGQWDIPAFTFPAAQMVARSLQKTQHIKEMVEDEGRIFEKDIKTNMIYNIDVNKENYNMQTSDLGSNIIVPVHQFGMPCDMDTINKNAIEHDAVVIQDAACALGSEYKGKKIGSEGTAVFSFHGRKILTTGEGGMIVTDDDELYERCVQMRQFGRDNNGKFVGHGLNFKMSDVAAAMGIGQMSGIRIAIRTRRMIADAYATKFNHMLIDGWQYHNYLNMPYQGRIGESLGTNWQSYVIKLHEKPGVKKRDDVLARMRNNGIEVQVGSYDNSNGECRNSAELARTTLALPIWPGMMRDDVELVAEELREALT